ncbi:MAG: glycoside hydrolase family protein [Planctomycetota bacterium]|jgi:rhamnogalacturonyl hydrolase YesR
MADFLDRALAAADWFAGTQVLMKKPDWDANFGRFVYTYHMPTRNRVLGLSWTQGRAIITLLAAWEATGDGKYLRSAIRGAEYIKHLQILDARRPQTFGAIREEVPASWYVYPRDAMEAGLGLLFLWRVTGDEDLLYRSRVFGDWLISHSMRDGWPTGGYYLDDAERAERGYRHIACIGGGAAFFANLAKATGESRYIDEGLRPMAEHMVEHFVREDGVHMTVPLAKRTPEMAAGASGGDRYRGVALNDDCAGISMLIAHRELGGGEYLDLTLKYGDWMLADPGPVPRHSGPPLMALTLLDLAEVSGERRYADFAREVLAPRVTGVQVLGSGDPVADGAFRGEDENPDDYVSGARAEEFVNTRMTAYAASALFKLDGKVFGPYYSALGWEREVPKPDPEDLKPFRL